MATRLEIYKKRLEMYLQAEEAILNGAQHYQIGTRSITRADLSEVRKVISDLMNKVALEEAAESGRKRNRTVGVVFRDW